MKIFRICMFALLLLAIGYAALPASADLAQSPFLFFKDLRVGMEGIGKTTIRDNQVRIFQTRIIGLLDNPGELNDYILVRSSGDLIREAGGYAQGMSGSPIYIDDRLIGAFFGAFIFDESPNPIGVVRPIETMLKLIEPIRKAVESETRPAPSPERLEKLLSGVRLEDGVTREVEFVSRPPSLEERRAHPERIYAAWMGSPLWVGGLSGRALEWLKEGVDPQLIEEYSLLPLSPSMERTFLKGLETGLEERYGMPLYPLAAAAAPAEGFEEEFEPGRPMAALLTSGDITLGGVCTTSYIDPQTNVLLACGHQLFLTGESSLFLTKARVIDTVNSAQVSFVLPTVDRTQISGAVLEDRFQAIGASLDHEPPVLKLSVHVKDATTGATRDLNIKVADVDAFIPSLVFLSLLQAVDTTINRIGPGTMRIEYTIRGDELPKKLERSDVFASFNDVALAGPLQVAQVVFLLDQNEFLDPQLERIDVDMVITDPVRWLRVAAIQTDKEVYHPGETVKYSVLLKAYRGSDYKVTGDFQLPEEIDAKRLTLQVIGGPRRQQNNQGLKIEYSTLEELIEAIEELTTNDQLTVELLGLSNDDNDEDENPFKDVQKLGDWVITGEERSTIEIEVPEEPEPSEEEPKGSEEQPQPEEECDQLFYCD